MKIVQWLLTLAFFTGSFDVFLVVDLGGANFRIAQLALLCAMVCAMASILQNGRILWARGASALALWCLVQGILVLRSPAIFPSFLLFLLLMLSVFGVFTLVQLYGASPHIATLFKSYLNSFVFVAIFGLYQLVSPALHLGYPFIVQWIVHGLIPRINGFNFEPSFYATYMILGWITLVELRLSHAAIVSGRKWAWFIVLVTLALLLSTSKIGWIMMIIESGLRLLPFIFRPLRRSFRLFSRGDLRVPIPSFRALAWVVTACLATVLTLILVGRVVNLNVFLSGTGLNNTPAHSVNVRMQQFQDTEAVIRQDPWLGYSLGGVAERIAQIKNEPYSTTAAVKTHWGFPVPVEVYAASGLVGIIPFLWFFYRITAGERTLLRSRSQDERAKWLRALIRALIFEWLCLAVDQNLVRVYLWLHIGVLMAVAYNLRHRSEVTALPHADSIPEQPRRAAGLSTT
jgi:hypothetical protein